MLEITHEQNTLDAQGLTTKFALSEFAQMFGRVWSVSGLYADRDVVLTPSQYGRPRTSSVVRLDVDGYFPLNVASGTFYGDRFSSLYHGSDEPVHWIAYPLKRVSSGVWEGEIIRRWPAYPSLLPHTSVRVQVDVIPISYLGARMTVTFFGFAPDATYELRFESPYFHAAEFEYDVVEGASLSTLYRTGTHPNRPSSLADEQLSITKVYGRAGIEVLQSPNRSNVLLSLAGEDATWTNQELHDAMRTYWSRYKPRAQWAAWMLFAGRHVERRLGGIMFDYQNGSFQRQGAAVFCDALADAVPPGEAHQVEWFARERFFAAVHELGHSFNLNHSFQKIEPSPWRNLKNEDRARSFMNYPSRVQQEFNENFWESFFYRFDDDELYFMRHAPEHFVEMGANEAGVDHGFEPDQDSSYAGFSLELGVTRVNRVFEFLEPIIVEVRLKNTSNYPRLVDPELLSNGHGFELLIGPRTGPARRWHPYVHECSFGLLRVLNPGESLTASIFASAGLGGWQLAETGFYRLSAAVRLAGHHIVAAPLTLRVASARSIEEDCLAQDYFTDDVGRTLAFGGTHVMTSANDALRDIAARFGERAVARHALVALALPQMTHRKALRVPDGEARMSSVSADGGNIRVVPGDPDGARRMLDRALLTEPEAAVETLGYLGYQRAMRTYYEWLEASGESKLAEQARAVAQQMPQTTRGICSDKDRGKRKSNSKGSMRSP